jgi:endonuclease III
MKKDIEAILKQLTAMHGKPRVELNYANPLELTVAVVLSAQCTDERVNRVTEHLFKKYTQWRDYADVPLQELEEDIRPTGFYRNKSKSLKSIAGEVKDRFGGKVPDNIDTFASVRGIGRKSANMIVGLAYGKPAIIVDTHMSRVAERIGLTSKTDPEKIETDLRRDVPEKEWTEFSLLMIIHGRYICKARKPDCPDCLLRDGCDYWQRQAAPVA